MSDEKHDVLVGEDGNIIPMDPHEVRASVNRIVDQGRLIALVAELDGQMAVTLLDAHIDPLGVAAMLTQAAKQLRHAVRKQ